jgi:hypothetical protein
MAPLNYENPDSTSYKLIAHECIVYINPIIHHGIEIIKQVKPSYPQSRRNKRDNFKLNKERQDV